VRAVVVEAQCVAGCGGGCVDGDQESGAFGRLAVEMVASAVVAVMVVATSAAMVCGSRR
jgi:hypothetical protein